MKKKGVFQMANEREVQEKVIQMRYLEGQANSMQQQMIMAENALISIDTAINSLTELQKSKPTESLTPLGAGVFTYTTLKSTEKVLIDIGSGVVVEKPIAESVKILEERRENALSTAKSYADMLENIKAKYQEIGMRVQELRK
jgi:prefoldin alpha subunit